MGEGKGAEDILSLPDDALNGILKYIESASRPRPELIRHYTTAQGLGGILESGALWASSCHHLNDSQELRHAFERTAELARELADGESGVEFRAFLNGIEKHVLKTLEWLPAYVVSFSWNGELSQWRGYGEPYASFAIEFDSDELVSRLLKHGGGWFQPCLYDVEVQRDVIRRVLEGYRPLVEGDYEPEWVLTSSFLEISYFAPLMKDPTFREEGEWRYIHRRPTGREGLKLRTVEAGLVPYVEVGLGKRTKDLPIHRIVVGPSPRQSDNVSAVQLYLKSEGAPFEVHPSHIPYRGW